MTNKPKFQSNALIFPVNGETFIVDDEFIRKCKTLYHAWNFKNETIPYERDPNVFKRVYEFYKSENKNEFIRLESLSWIKKLLIEATFLEYNELYDLSISRIVNDIETSKVPEIIKKYT